MEREEIQFECNCGAIFSVPENQTDKEPKCGNSHCPHCEFVHYTECPKCGKEAKERYK